MIELYLIVMVWAISINLSLYYSVPDDSQDLMTSGPAFVLGALWPLYLLLILIHWIRDDE